MENLSWNLFTATGRVEDYLRYKGEYGQTGEHGQEEDRTDRTGEEAVWERPLR